MRPRWKGTLQVGLVSVPVYLYASTDKDTKPAGHHVHRTCQTQLKQKKWCPACEVEPAGEEIMRGFEVPGHEGYVELAEEELDGLKVESTRTIVIERVAPVEELDPLLVSGTLYLTNDQTIPSAEAEAVLLAAMAGKVGIGTIVLNQREQRVALMVYGGRFVVQTLRSASAVREMPMSVRVTADPKMVALAKQLVATFEGPLDLESTRDGYADGMWTLLRQKAGLEPAPAASSQTSVPQSLALKDALLAALEAAPKPAPAKMTVVKGRKTGTRG